MDSPNDQPSRIKSGTPIESRLSELSDYIKTGEAGMQTFDQHLLKLYQEKVISGTEALHHATNPGALAMALRGIKPT